MISVFIEHIQKDLASLQAEARRCLGDADADVFGTIFFDSVTVTVTYSRRIKAQGKDFGECIEKMRDLLRRYESHANSQKEEPS